MNTEECRLRVRSIILPRSKVPALFLESPWLGAKFKYAGWVIPDDWEFGQNEKIKARFVRIE